MTIHKNIQLISGVLATLFIYAALSKLSNYDQSRNEMLNQIFPREWALLFTWLIPSIELIVTLLLLLKPTLKLGLWASALLMLAFSAYIAVVLSGAFGRIPCSCGGIFRQMGYQTHLAFNLAFLGLAIYGIYLTHHTHLKKGGPKN
jgi:uncharacterized membrane protein YphA (DoxX/SURF4 family)